MALPSVVVNYVATLVAAIVSMVIGALWYSPVLFGNAWMKAGGMTQKDIDAAKKKGMGKLYLAAFVGALVLAIILAHVIGFTNVSTASEGLQLSLWLWLGFIAPILLSQVLWENKPVRYYAINVAYWLVNLIVMSLILVSWR